MGRVQEENDADEAVEEIEEVLEEDNPFPNATVVNRGSW